MAQVISTDKYREVLQSCNHVAAHARFSVGAADMPRWAKGTRGTL